MTHAQITKPFIREAPIRDKIRDLLEADKESIKESEKGRTVARMTRDALIARAANMISREVDARMRIYSQDLKSHILKILEREL